MAALYRRLITALAIAVVLAVANTPVIHGHTSSEPGLYNADCSLAHLATRGTGVSVVPAQDHSLVVPFVRDAHPSSGSPAPSHLLGAADCRAPPAS